MRARLISGLVAMLAVAAACENGPSSPEDAAQIRILLTDAPADMIASAEVWISRVYLQGGEEDEAAWIDLFNDPENPAKYDLLLLRDGVTADLTELVSIESGTYSQLRLIVDRAEVTLADGYTFDDGTNVRELFVPSGAQSGIKVQLADAIDADAGTTTTVLVDFDVDRNFVIQGNVQTPTGIHGILFTPVLLEKSRESKPGS